jgi:hypothetical protein
MQMPERKDIPFRAETPFRLRICVCCGEQMTQASRFLRNPNLCDGCAGLVDCVEETEPPKDAL